MSAATFMRALCHGRAQNLVRPPLLVSVSSSLVRRRAESSQPVSAARVPRRVKLAAGKRYSWCACGHSEKQPFCDGAHRAAAPDIKPLRFTVDRDQTVLLCACKHTGNAPYCDGTHFKVVYRDLVKSVTGFFK